MKSNINYAPIEYAKLACDTMMSKFKAEELPPEKLFHYHQGVFLSGMERTYLATGEQKYSDYIKAWVDSIVYEDGSMHEYDKTRLDDLQPGILLFRLYHETGDKRYKIVIENIADILKHWYVNDEGGFWHKECHPNQMWLDGLYMAGPFMTMYGKEYSDSSRFDVMLTQTRLMTKHNRDNETGLLYHACDCSKEEDWADEKSGCSPCFWGRAMGWYAVAILDMLDYLPEDFYGRAEMLEYLTEFLTAVEKYQDKKEGLWYQLVDKTDDPQNWFETSCSALFVYAFAKAVRKGYISKKFKDAAVKGYNGVINKLIINDDKTVIVPDICVGTGVGDYQFYIDRPVCENDLHGMGAFVLMCTEYDLMCREELSE